MSQILSKIKESLGNLFFGRGIVVPLGASTYGKTPTDPTFADALDYYERDVNVKASIDDLTERTVGSGFWLTSSESDEDEKAKKIIDNFCALVGLDQMNFWIARDNWLVGNSFTEKIWEKSEIVETVIDKTTNEKAQLLTRVEGTKLVGLKNLPLDTIKKVKFSKQGQIQFLEAGIGFDTVRFAPSNFIHYCWNRVSSNPLGVGLINPLIKKGHGFYRTSESTEKEYRPNILEVSERMELDMAKILNNFADPNQIIVLEGLSDEELAAKKDEIKALKAGERFATNRPANIVSSTVDFRAKFDSFIEHFETAKIVALETPVVRLYTEKGAFTEASANAALKMSEIKIDGFKRFLKRMHERELFDPLLRQAGFDPITVEVRLNWGLPERPKPLEANVLVQLIQIQAQTGYEVIPLHALQDYVKKIWGIEWEEPAPVKSVTRHQSR